MEPVGIFGEALPTLVGERLELRPLGEEDFDAVYAAGRDPLIWEQHPESNRYEPEVFRRFFDGAITSRGGFAVVDRETGRIIGCTRYDKWKPDESQVEIGWTFLERAYWGGTYNGEMKALMLDYAFRFVDRAVFVVGERNFRSQKALQKIGAALWKSVPEIDHDGTPVTTLIFAIERRQR